MRGHLLESCLLEMATNSTLLPPETAFALLAQNKVGIDVRSPKEFGKGDLPSTQNIPILDDEHRHLVGCSYQNEGNKAAITLGHKLVEPIKNSLVNNWLRVIGAQDRTPLFCWRGGLRSQIATDWISNAGGQVERVEGGFRAIRRVALSRLESPPPLLIVSGWTGSGKTEVFQEHSNFLDLEEAAAHRGSAFGKRTDRPQPSQISFENRLAIELSNIDGRVLVEDEARMIGIRHVPEVFYEAMAKAPSIFLESPLQERAIRIYEGYVLSVLESGTSIKELTETLVTSVERISRRLGDQRASAVKASIEDAFSRRSTDVDRHLPWIKTLLTKYYDKSYQHALEKKGRRILFRGNARECLGWLEHTDLRNLEA